MFSFLPVINNSVTIITINKYSASHGSLAY